MHTKRLLIFENNEEPLNPKFRWQRWCYLQEIKANDSDLWSDEEQEKPVKIFCESYSEKAALSGHHRQKCSNDTLNLWESGSAFHSICKSEKRKHLQVYFYSSCLAPLISGNSTILSVSMSSDFSFYKYCLECVTCQD